VSDETQKGAGLRNPAYDLLRRVGDSITLHHREGGIGSFRERSTLPTRSVPFALIARLDGATVELTLGGAERVTVPPGQAFFILPNRPHARVIMPHELVTSSWAHLSCSILNTVDLFKYVHPPCLLPESVGNRFVEYSAFMVRPLPSREDAAATCRHMIGGRAHAFGLQSSLCDCASIDRRVTE
jgi:hypothetical protein